MAKNEEDKMMLGLFYNSSEQSLVRLRDNARLLLRRLNGTSTEEQRAGIYKHLFGSLGKRVSIEPPFFCDYGKNIHLGSRVFFNFNCVVLDPAEVVIGNDVLIGPSVQIYTATHPMSHRLRRKWLEIAKPVKIGSDVWIGGAAIICPGVTIGQGAVIGAGSVVTRDIPRHVFAAGNPCRVIKELSPNKALQATLSTYRR